VFVWTSGRESNPLLVRLQLTAFPIRHHPLVAAPGFEPGSRPNLGLAGYKPTALPLSYAADLVRVRCSAHRPRRSKRRTLLARASPCYLERTAGIEPACLPVRGRALIHLSYVRDGSHRRNRTRLCPVNGRPRAPCSPDGNDWWRNRESNPGRRSCKDQLQPAAFPVPGRGFEPRSLRLQRSAFTRLAYQALFGADAGNRNRAR
jgi:hypothetical protein